MCDNTSALSASLHGCARSSGMGVLATHFTSLWYMHQLFLCMYTFVVQRKLVMCACNGVYTRVVQPS